MKAEVIYSKDGCQWLVFGRDSHKADRIIDTNQYMVKVGNEAVLLDPGGIEIFSTMLASVVNYAPLDQIRHIFASHQDPDIISSLGLWDRTLPSASLYAPRIWEGFIRHYGCNSIDYVALPDEGQSLKVGGREFVFLPAHYLHSSGNFHFYDPEARLLMSGDVGAALMPADAPMYVSDFDSHTALMKGFHQRWMPSNDAKNDWIARVRKLDIQTLAPQHGAMFRGDDVKRFLDWFEALEVGIGSRSAAA